MCPAHHESQAYGLDVLHINSAALDNLYMKIDQLMGRVIRHRREAAGWTQQDLADATQGEIDQGRVSRIERGKEGISPEKLQSVAKAFGCRVSQLWAEAEELESMAVGEPQTRYDIPKAAGVSYVPLISYVQAGHWSDPTDAYARGTGEKLIATSIKVGRLAYALRIRGDSMTNPRGDPSFPDGTIVIVDPGKRSDVGSFVIVRLSESDETTFKRLTSDSGKQLLVPLNPQYPAIPLDQEAHFCGVVVGIAERDL